MLLQSSVACMEDTSKLLHGEDKILRTLLNIIIRVTISIDFTLSNRECRINFWTPEEKELVKEVDAKPHGALKSWQCLFLFLIIKTAIDWAFFSTCSIFAHLQILYKWLIKIAKFQVFWMLRCDVCNYFTNNKVRNKVKNYKLWFLRNK